MNRFLQLAVVVATSLVLSGCTTILDKNNKAGLQVITDDITASIFLDGQYVDRTPFINKELKPASYTLKIEPEDQTLVPYETTITLRKGLLTVVTWKPGTRAELSGGVVYELEKLPNRKQTELSVVSIPDGAVVSVDSGAKEFAPYLTSELVPGSHELSVTLPSYETQEHTINIVEGHRLNILVKLAKSPSALAPAETTPAAVTEPTIASESATASNSAAKKPPTATASGKPLITPSASQTVTGPKVTITSTNFFQDGVEVLRVRDQANASGKELGFAQVGSSYQYLGKEEAGWYNIQFGTQTGWVNKSYAKLEK
jgi:uncharacterized protein YgiM (DUF1202 family)